MYFEETAAQDYREMKKYETPSNSNYSHETTEFTLTDTPADVWVPDDED